METDPPSLEKTNQGGSTPGESGSSHVRSYDCTFCKKGFSNAQALGGHMNIHRRDRMSKQPPKDTQFPMDLNPQKFPVYPTVSTLQSESVADGRSCTAIQWPWSLQREEDGVSMDGPNETGIRQLPLFVDIPAGDVGPRSVGHGMHEEKSAQWSHGSDGEQLDLELRLGPEPQDAPMVLKHFL